MGVRVRGSGFIPHLFKELAKMFRQGRAQVKAGIVRGLGDNQPRCMQEELVQLYCFAEQMVQGEIAVLVIAKDRVPRQGQMAAYLVHPACSQLKFQKGEAAFKNLNYTVAGFGFFFHAANLQIQADYPFTLRRPSLAYCHISLNNGARHEQAGVCGGGGFVFRGKDQAGGIPVQSVYQQRPLRPFLGKDAVQGYANALPPLHRKARRLVDHYTCTVFINDFNPHFYPKVLPPFADKNIKGGITPLILTDGAQWENPNVQAHRLFFCPQQYGLCLKQKCMP
jgi:hypothetical protein